MDKFTMAQQRYDAKLPENSDMDETDCAKGIHDYGQPRYIPSIASDGTRYKYWGAVCVECGHCIDLDP